MSKSKVSFRAFFSRKKESNQSTSFSLIIILTLRKNELTKSPSFSLIIILTLRKDRGSNSRHENSVCERTKDKICIHWSGADPAKQRPHSVRVEHNYQRHRGLARRAQSKYCKDQRECKEKQRKKEKKERRKNRKNRTKKELERKTCLNTFVSARVSCIASAKKEVSNLCAAVFPLLSLPCTMRWSVLSTAWLIE